MEITVQEPAGCVTLGPVLFNWDPETWRDFYFRIADETPVATVYIGETVCSKRAPLIEPHYEPSRRSAQVTDFIKKNPAVSFAACV